MQLEMFPLDDLRGLPEDPTVDKCVVRRPGRDGHILTGYASQQSNGLRCTACRVRWFQLDGRFWRSPTKDSG